MTEHQPGIFVEGTDHHVFLEFELGAAVPSQLPAAAGALLPWDGGEQVVAFGPRLAETLSAIAAPNGDFGFRAIEGSDGHVAPATQRDLFVWLHGAKRDELFAQALKWREALVSVAALAAEDHGFLYRDSRDLTGFVDGTANPKGDVRQQAALVPRGPGAGGSFVLAQRWVHDLSGFAALATAQQERVIGRTKADSVELTGAAMPPDSHVSRTDLKRGGEPLRIYRRSSPAGGIADAGLFFLAFSAEVERFRILLGSMFGPADDGLRDRLLSWSRPISGSFYFAPPADALRTAFSA